MLFKNKKIQKGIRAVYYGGELNGFTPNCATQIFFEENNLIITRINPDLKVTLGINKIQGIEIYNEEEYMIKYYGGAPVNKKEIPKIFFVINYGHEKDHIDFWCTTFEFGKIKKIQQKLISNNTVEDYTL